MTVLQKRDFVSSYIAAEVRQMVHIHHPNVVATEEVFEVNELCFVVTELASGGNLGAHLKLRPFAEAQAQHFFRQVLRGVHHCHSKLVFHRDLALESVLLLNDGVTVKVGDFGNAIRVGSRPHIACRLENVAPEALAGAVALMLVTYPKHLDVPLSGVEWDMLVFFAALFVLINSMNSLGIIDLISSAIAAAVRPVADDKQLYVAMTIVLWFAAVMSAFLSSIPTTTMLIPVIQQMAANPQLSLPLRPLIWALSLGSCFGGNGTLIGAPSSLVVAGVVRSKGYFITFASFSKVSALITTALVVLSNIYLILIYGVLGWGH